MKIRLDRSRRGSLLDQARDQITSSLHAGLLRSGDRLPSLRQVAALSGLNVKTVLRIYAALQREGWVSMRKGSGAFVTLRGQDEIEPAQAFRLARLLRRHLDEASGADLSPPAYASLVHRLVARSSLRGRLLMIVSSTAFFPAFRRALGLLGLQPDDLDRISVIAGSDRAGVRRALGEADFAYVSPLCRR